MSNAEVGVGNVPITIGGQEYMLVPTVMAAKTVSRLGGGIRGAMDAVLRLDLEVIEGIIRAGLGQSTVKRIPDFENALFKAGLTVQGGEVAGKCIEFCSILANGGRPAEDEGAPQSPQQG